MNWVNGCRLGKGSEGKRGVQSALTSKNRALRHRQCVARAQQREQRRPETKEASEMTRRNSKGDFNKVQMSSGAGRLDKGMLNSKE